jgi:hypothetical protein
MKTLVLLLLLAEPVIALQERASTGQIYQELIPFVGLDGVRFEVHGLEAMLFDVVPPIPQTTANAINRERLQIAEAILADTRDAFGRAGIPLLGPFAASDKEVRPVLVIDINWHEVKPEVLSVEITGHLMEPAHPLKDSSRIVWWSSWSTTYGSTSSRQTLASDLKASSHGVVGQFIDLYVRAHRK